MQTSPLAKAITTTEGILTVVFNGVIAVVAVVPTHGLNPTVAAIVSAASVIALTGQRGLIKAKALQSSAIGQEVLDNPGAALKSLSNVYVAAPDSPPEPPAQKAPAPSPASSSAASPPPPAAAPSPSAPPPTA